jgi:PAS domain S-box-containing protein
MVFSTTIVLSYRYHQRKNIQQLQSELNLIKENIRKIMTNGNLSAFSVGLTIDPDDDTVRNFEFVAREIMSKHSYLFGVQILRKGEIEYVYPFEMHKSVLGYDILKDPKTQIEAESAIDNKQIYYAGPLEFKQGGLGIIGRLPIYHENKFWGFSAVLIEMDAFLDASGINSNALENISFRLSKVNPNTGQEEIFTSKTKKEKSSLQYTFEESGWHIQAHYEQDSIVLILLIVIICLTIASSVGGGLLTYQILLKPEKLEVLLSEKMLEIEENNEYLRSLVQAIPDYIFIYDNEGRYLDFHTYKNATLYYQPKEFIGKSVYELFDKEFAQKIHDFVKKAINSNKIEVQEYSLDFPEGRSFFESRLIAINSDKVLSLVRETTKTVLSSRNLVKSEKKYRSLVSQASDSIFLSDENGNLLELNDKGQEMSGIKGGNIENLNLDVMINLDKETGSSLLELIHQKGKVFVEAEMVSIDGRIIPVEINCQSTEERLIHGIIRDISSRNQYIKSIKDQNERLKEIAWIQSHEVRSPLAKILGLLDYLENFEKADQKDKKRIIDSIRASSLQLDYIIRDVVARTEEAEKG